MAPLSKDQLVDLIKEKIEPNGNTRAIEVREVLNELLDYATHEPDDNDLKPFHFFTANDPVKSGESARLWYSFKGLVKQTVNFTFKLEITSAQPHHTFKFDLGNIDHYKILKEINERNHLSFIIPIYSPFKDQNTIHNKKIPWNLIIIFISFEDEGFLTIRWNQLLRPLTENSVAYTSVQMHVVKNFGLIDKELKNFEIDSN